jgi:hypothetical protein
VSTDAIIANQRLLTQAINALARALTNATCMKVTPVTFANLPASPTQGMIGCVTDSTVTAWGSTVAGGGANQALVWYNGARWTVIGQ